MEKIENKETFFARYAPVVSDYGLKKIKLAYILSKFGHRAQHRKEAGADGKPVRYFEHPRGVALILFDELHISDWEMTCAALLHDGPEDTDDLTLEFIEEFFETEVALLVKMVSKIPKAGFEQRLANFAGFKALVLKACDRLHNLRTLQHGSEEFQRKQVKETREVYLPIFQRMIELAPPGRRFVAAYLIGKIVGLLKVYEEKFNAPALPPVFSDS